MSLLLSAFPHRKQRLHHGDFGDFPQSVWAMVTLSCPNPGQFTGPRHALTARACPVLPHIRCAVRQLRLERQLPQLGEPGLLVPLLAVGGGRWEVVVGRWLLGGELAVGGPWFQDDWTAVGSCVKCTSCNGKVMKLSKPRLDLKNVEAVRKVWKQ